MFDVAIIGAGINGCAVAHALKGSKKRVAIFDKEGVAAGGSGAAGAFISPKFSKAGELKELLEEAFLYSMEFYAKEFKDHFTQAQLIHFAQDEEDAAALEAYKKSSPLELLDVAGEQRSYVSLNAGLVDAKHVTHSMALGSEVIVEEVVSLYFDDGVWVINESYSAKEVVLATGAYLPLIKEPYLSLRGIWGHRIEVKTSTKNPYSLHQAVSISPSKNGRVAIGATHNVHYHPQTAMQPYDFAQGRAELLEKAARTLKLEDVEILEDFVGLRSGSFDYLPLVGPLVMSEETMQNAKLRLKVKNLDFASLEYYPHLTMINGSGGYGFVLAPYLAQKLKEFILDAKELDKRVHPARMFARWVRKL